MWSYKSPNHRFATQIQSKTLDLKSSMCRKISNAAKTILNVDITVKDLFESINPLRAPAPPAPFKFTSTKVNPVSKTIPKASTVLKSITPPSNTFRHDRYPFNNFLGINILFWNCQGIRPKGKELELYLRENVINVIALNETFLSKKHNFKIPGYDTIRNDHSTGYRGVAFLVKHGSIVNKEYRNNDFNIMTDNEALAINLELSNKQNITLATIYCPNGNLNLTLFQTINNLSDNVMFVRISI